MTRFAPILMLAALCGSACAQSVEVHGLADVSALVAKQDELLARIKELEHFKHTPTAVNVLDYGCKPDDPGFDNGPPLNKLFANCGIKAGNFRQEIYIPGGRYHFTTPIVLPQRTGLAIRGNGLTIGLTEQHYEGGSQQGGPASILIYDGPAIKPAVTYYGVGLRWDGVCLQRGEYTAPRTDAKRDGSVGFLVTCYPGLPSAKAHFPNIHICGFDIGFASERRAADSDTSNNCDNLHFGFPMMQNNNVAFQVASHQSVDWTFEHLWIGFKTEVVFDCVEAAHIRCNFMVNNSPATIIRFGEPGHKPSPGSNNALLDFPHIKVDQTSSGWKLFEQRVKGTVPLRATVHLGKQGTLDGSEIQLLPEPGRVDIDVRAYQDGVWKDWRDGKWLSAADNLGGAK